MNETPPVALVPAMVDWRAAGDRPTRAPLEAGAPDRRAARAVEATAVVGGMDVMASAETSRVTKKVAWWPALGGCASTGGERW